MKKQWEIRNNGRIKMNEGNNGKMDENAMGDQEKWKDQDERKTMGNWTKMDENAMEDQEQWKDQDERRKQ